MNYLAHIYLSGDEELIKIGNFVADSIKGNKYKLFQTDIQKGILLHRQIDSFTDSDSTVRESKKRLHLRYNHYKGVIVDILYDHFLAKNWDHYSQVPLQLYARSFYNSLEDNYQILPENIKYLMPYMIKQDWLSNYASTEGIEKILIGMNKRTKERASMHLAIDDLNENYEDFENDFTHFFEKLRNFSAIKLQEINKSIL